MQFIVEEHSDGFLAYPLGLEGVVVGQGDARDEALADAQSAAKFHLDTFGNEAATFVIPSERQRGRNLG